jgi:hypothetical protein
LGRDADKAGGKAVKSNGRYHIKDLKSGRVFLVEAIGNPRTDFGDSLDDKCTGSIREKDSEITPETHTNIGYAKNPADYIGKLLAKGDK